MSGRLPTKDVGSLPNELVIEAHLSREIIKMGCTGLKMLDQIKNKHILIDGDIVLKTAPWQGTNGYWYHGNDELVHRFVVEQKLRIRLERPWVVHHIDRNKSNNLMSNLVPFPSQKEHLQLHANEDCISAGFNPAEDLICSNCKTYHNKSEFARNKSHARGYAQSCRRSFNELRIVKGWNKNKWSERAKLLQQIRRAKAKAVLAEQGRRP